MGELLDPVFRRHPLADGGDSDYDGIQRGRANLASWHTSSGRTRAYEAHQARLMLLSLSEGVKRAARTAGLETVEELMFLLSALVYGVPRETWVIHRSEGFKRPGQICKKSREIGV